MEREVERRMERDERGRGEKKRGRRQRRWWKKRNKRTQINRAVATVSISL